MNIKKRIINNKFVILVLVIILILIGMYYIYTKPLDFTQLIGRDLNNNEIKCDITISKAEIITGKIVASSNTAKLNTSQTNELNKILNKYKYRKVVPLTSNSKRNKILDGYSISIIYYSEKNIYNHLVIDESAIIKDFEDNQRYRIDKDEILELIHSLRLYIE